MDVAQNGLQHTLAAIKVARFENVCKLVIEGGGNVVICAVWVLHNAKCCAELFKCQIFCGFALQQWIAELFVSNQNFYNVHRAGDLQLFEKVFCIGCASGLHECGENPMRCPVYGKQ